MPDFKKAVRVALAERELTMTALAEQLGISVSYLSELLNGSRNSGAQIARIKEVLGIGNEDERE